MVTRDLLTQIHLMDSSIQPTQEQLEELYYKAYRSDIIREVQRLFIFGREFDLSKLYIRVSFLKQQRPKEPRLLEGIEKEELLHKKIAQETKQHKESSVPAIENISPEDALRRFPKFVIIGDPGSGKTTALSHLALRLAQKEIQGFDQLPVFIRLADWAKSGLDLKTFMVDRYFGERHEFEEIRGDLLELMEHGKVIFLLDGLDEIPEEMAPAATHAEPSGKNGTSLVEKLAKDVAAFSQLFDTIQIGITSRRAFFERHQHLFPSDFEILETRPFDSPARANYISTWFGDDPKGQKLKDALEANSRLQQLASTPLLLAQTPARQTAVAAAAKLPCRS